MTVPNGSSTEKPSPRNVSSSTTGATATKTTKLTTNGTARERVPVVRREPLLLARVAEQVDHALTA